MTFDGRLPCGAKSLRVDSVCQRFSKPIQRLRIVHLASSEERKTPDRWGERPGVGVLLRGAGGNSFCLVHLMYGQHADLPQLFVGEIRLFLFACDFFVPESRFARDAVQFHFRKTQQHRRAAPGYVFELLCFHGCVPHAVSRTMESSSTARIMAL